MTMSKEDDFFGDYDESPSDVDTEQEDTSEPLMDESSDESEVEPVFEEPARPDVTRAKPRAKKKATKPKPKAKKKTSKTSRKPAARKTSKKKVTSAKKKKSAKPKKSE